MNRPFEIENYKNEIGNLKQKLSLYETQYSRQLETERGFWKIFHNSSDAILILGGDKFIDCNESAVRMLKAGNIGKLCSKHPSDISPEKQPDGKTSYDKANEMISIAFDKGYNRFEWMHKKLDGEVFPVEVSLTAVEYKNNIVLHAHLYDISLQKKTEVELEKYRKTLKMLVRRKTNEIELTRNNTIETLATLAEFRNPELGGHICRCKKYLST
jgi:PAS domain S-box-containing protein